MTLSRKVSWKNYLFGIAVRLVLLNSSYKSYIQDRVEVSTPLNSWKRLKEGIYLYDINVNPYSGDLFHESPLLLITCRFLINNLGRYVELLYALMDIFAAHLLYKTASIYIPSLKKKEEENQKKGKYLEIAKNLMLTDKDVKNVPIYAAYAYLFNPYIIVNCVGLTTTNFSNLILAGFFYSMVKGKKFICILLLSLITHQTFYLFTLLVPVCLYFYNTERSKTSVFQIVILYIFLLAGLLGICFQISGNWEFIKSTYGFILYVNDLTPNMGLFWYFFTEMFDHFRALFLSALQINATVLYLFPLALHLRKDPVFLSFIIIALTAVFKSYPSLGDVGFYFCLIPMWKHLFFFMQQSFITSCFIIVTSILGPAVWHLWIYSGSANANFYFGVTLAFATAEIFLITDMLFAHKKRLFALKNGLPEDSSEGVLLLE